MRNDNAKTDYTAIVAAYAKQDRRHWRRQDYYTYAYSLQKLRQYEAGHGVAREGLLRWPQDERLGRVYGWCVYYAYILPFRREAGNRDVYFRAVRSILQYCRQSPYTPYERTVWHLLQTFQGDPHLSHAERDRYISALDPELLAANACHADGEGILSCTQSPREKWYALKTKYAVKLKQYDRCIALCEEALRRFPECHNNNDIWFSYRIAYCHLLQGQTDRSEREFQALLRYSRHWIVYRGLMYAAVRKKDDRKALQYGSMAMLAPGEVTAKIHVLTELATLLRNRQDMQTAYWHEAWTVYWREKKKLAYGRGLAATCPAESLSRPYAGRITNRVVFILAYDGTCRRTVVYRQHCTSVACRNRRFCAPLYGRRIFFRQRRNGPASLAQGTAGYVLSVLSGRWRRGSTCGSYTAVVGRDCK